MPPSPPMLYAHTPAKGGQEWHLLADHLRDVARRAACFAAPFGGEDHAHLIGLLHDVGKAHPDFQAYLQTCHAEPERKHRGPDHKVAGAAQVDPRSGLPQVLLGHHGGLPDASDSGPRIQAAVAQDKDRLLVAWQRFMELGLPLPPEVPEMPAWISPGSTGHDLFLRMLFSCLVDADVLDTEAHWTAAHADLRATPTPSLEELWRHFEQDQAALIESVIERDLADTPVNQVRAEVYDACLRDAARAPGLYRLTVPTGGGKTRASTAFALRHALVHGKARIIYAVPFLTITEQTVDVLRRAFGSDLAVLEHHSGVEIPDESASGEERVAEKWRRLASENWDAPFIVTTTVQLFESLFTRMTSRSRKLHNIANSVIVLDEFQTVPAGLRAPIFDVLAQLVRHYGVTVLLCTATQPVLDTIEDELEAAGLAVHEIAPNPAQAFATLQRVTYEWPAADEQWSWERVAEEIRAVPSSLTIVNTVANAATLYATLGDPNAWHLSTRMCGAHRRAVLATMRERLANGKSCRVVSTQLVEAGVDIDFPVVFRALAPLDAIAQAAGRCNREGRLDDLGQVVVFEPADGGRPPGVYKHATDKTRTMLKEGIIDYANPDTFDTYFRRLYTDEAADRLGIQPLRRDRQFEAVSDAFRMIDEDTFPVWVAYDDAARMARAALERAVQFRQGSLRDAYRRLQPYLVTLRWYTQSTLLEAGLIVELAPGVWEWKGEYDKDLGLDLPKIPKRPDVVLDPASLFA